MEAGVGGPDPPGMQGCPESGQAAVGPSDVQAATGVPSWAQACVPTDKLFPQLQPLASYTVAEGH